MLKYAKICKNMLKYAVLILWRKKGAAANFYAFCISDFGLWTVDYGLWTVTVD